MANNLRVFNTNSEYQSADLVHPAVSYVVETDKVIYDYTPPTPPVFQGKWKATYQDSHVESAQCGSSSEIVGGEINPSNLVSVEIGDCVTSIGDWAFDGCISLTSIDIPNSVTSIRNGVFQGCRSLTSCTIGSGVTSIEDFAFANCSGLTSIDIPDSVTSIGNYAFNYCSSLTSVTIGSGITSIGDEAFVSCGGLRSVTVKATTPPTLGKSAFFFLLPLCKFYVPSQSVNAYKSASGWKNCANKIKPIP